MEQFYGKGMQELEMRFDMNFEEDESKKTYLTGYTFDNIKDMNEELANKLRKELQIGLMGQESVDTIKQRIKKVMDVGEVRARMIARTETNRAENFGRLDAAKQSDLNLKKYLQITHDSRTSKISKAMHKKYGTPEQAIPLDENFRVEVEGKIFEGPAPPFHPNERDRLEFVQIE